MLHLSAIDAPTLELLKSLMQLDALSGLRLVGGTALALQTGHRKSVDIDLFGKIDFEELDIVNLFSGFRSVTTIKRSKNINIFIIDDTKVDFVNYGYPWLQPVVEMDNIRLAGEQDIAAMKLAAVTGRGSRKDFVDIYFLLKKYTLEKILDFYNRKYHDGSEYLVLKSLTYFEDAENDPPANMLTKIPWENIKKEIVNRVKAYTG